jgi:hypothetical protein
MKSYFLIIALSFYCVGIMNAQGRTIKTEELEILLVADYVNVYSDRGTGSNTDLSIWKPKPVNGFHALGHIAKAGHGAPKSVTIMVKSISNRAPLRNPVDYKFFYNDAGTGGDQDCSMWIPVPPAGYTALGSVAIRSHGKPSLSEVVCVRNDLTTIANVGRQIWNDAGSGGNYDLTLWRINPPSFPKDSKLAYLTSGSFVGHASHSALKTSALANAIRVKMPSSDKKIIPKRPQLTSMSKPDDKTPLILNSISYLPCISIADPGYKNNPQGQIKATPIYTLERYDYYKLQDFNTSSSPNEGEMSFEIRTGMETSREKSMETTFETSVTTEAGVETGVYSASISVTMSYALSQSETISRSETKESASTKTFPVPGKGAGALYTLSHEYRLKRANGEVIDAWTLNRSYSHFTDYDPSRKVVEQPKAEPEAKQPVADNNVPSGNNSLNLWSQSAYGSSSDQPFLADIDGDKKADRVIYEAASGRWGAIIDFTKGSFDNAVWGSSAYQALIGDLNGDGKDDRVVYSPSNGNWGGWLTDGGKSSFDGKNWGSKAYQALVADVNGDGKDDRVLFNPTNGNWGAWLTDGGQGSFDAQNWSAGNYIPLMADVNGDGKADRVVFNQPKGKWKVKFTDGGAGNFEKLSDWGAGDYLPLMADVNGDGKADRVVYSPSSGYWGVWITDGSGGSFDTDVWGGVGQIALLKDINGDGKADRVLYNKASGEWTYKITQ